MGKIPLYQWAKRNGIDPGNARRYAGIGRLPAEKLGRDWFIDEDYEWVDARRRQIVTLYKVFIKDAVMMSETGWRYSLTPYGDSTRDYKGDDDGGKQYYLPIGYTVGTSAAGEMFIFDLDDYPCKLGMRNDKPVLISADWEGVVHYLQPVETEAQQEE